MSDNKSTAAGGGLGLLGTLGVVFIVLKLVGVIHWSWWWVLAPFWLPWAFILGALVIWLGIMAAIGGINWIRGDR